MKENLIKLLKNYEALKEAFDKSEGELKTELANSLKEVLVEQINSFPQLVASEVSEWVDFTENMKIQVENKEDIKKWSDFSTELFGDWNEDAAKLTITGLLLAGATFPEEESGFVKYEDMYTTVTEGHALFGKETTVKLEDTIVSIEDYTYLSENAKDPAHTFGEKLIVKILGNYTESIPLIQTESGKILASTEDDFSLDIASKFLVDSDNIQKLEGILKSLEEKNLSVENLEQLRSVQNFPLVIKDSVLAELFLTEDAKTDYLAPLVGIVRKFGLTQDEFDSIKMKYSTLGRITLESILSKSWSPAEEAKPSQKEINSFSLDESSEPTTNSQTPLNLTKVQRKGKSLN